MRASGGFDSGEPRYSIVVSAISPLRFPPGVPERAAISGDEIGNPHSRIFLIQFEYEEKSNFLYQSPQKRWSFLFSI
jgi:hypothetical protein